MSLDENKIYLPSPDQSTTTGAIAVAPVGTDLPPTASEKLSEDWDDGGYVADTGLAVSTNISTVAIKDWSQAVVRKALSDFSGQIVFAFLQIDQFAAERLVGKDHVSVSDDDNTMTIDLGPHLGPIEAYCFSMKDGDQRIRVEVPRGQFESIDTVNFTPASANTWGGTLSCYPVDGVAIRVIYEDGTTIEGNVVKAANKDLVDKVIEE